MIEPPFRKKIFAFAVVVGVCLTSWLAGLFFFGWKIQSYTQDKTTPTDAIVVLTGGRNRIHEAIELLNTGLASKLFISGVPQNIQVGDIERVAGIKADVEEQVELGRQATNTIENAQEVADWCRQNGIKSIRLVTSNYHIPRSIADLNSHNLDLQV
ncbi:MAG: YdcF family protein, partial [Alphaproteobacteria bacterium]|nr:YdcF family protein [Alphaproteobacteria bacterium]